MLITALDDEDAQNVQLAARYLGSMRVRGAVQALAAVTMGEGRGNREPAVRIEAIEALGRIGSDEARPVLERLAGQRSVLRRGRSNEIRAAAQAALHALTSTIGQEVSERG